MSREDLGRSWKPWLRGTALGFPFGAMPTGGAEIPTFLSYATERGLARGEAREEFGKGAIEASPARRRPTTRRAGFGMRRYDFPIAPVILGVILGPLMEVKMREALDLSNGDISGLFNEPLAVAIYVLIVIIVVAPYVLGLVRKRRSS